MTTQSPSPESQIGQLLSRTGHLLLILFAALVAFDSVPVRLLQPDWILAFSATTSNTVAIPLLGLGLVQLAGHLAPTTQLKTQRRAALLAGLLALVFLLIQPLLIVASYKAGVNLSISNRRQAAAIEERGNTLVDAVKTATTFGQVQSRMAALQGPPILDESSTIPLPTLKQELLKSINSSQAILIARSKESTSQVLPQIYRQVARSAILCLIGSLGFSLLAWDPVRNRNLVFSYLGSIGIGGLTPASLAKRLGEATIGLRNSLRRTANENLKRRNARKLEQERKRQQENQKRDAKRREQERRKRLERFDRQRRQGSDSEQ